MLSLIKKQDWATLRANDQLCKAMSGAVGKRLLPHFVEAGPLMRKQGVGNATDYSVEIECPNFPPTFKVFSQFHKNVKENSEIDLVNDFQGQGKGGTVRVPSWCDRIIRSNHFGNRIEKDVTTLCYNSCRTVVTSDHKPVFAVFKLRARAQYLFDMKDYGAHVSPSKLSPKARKYRPVVQIRSLSAVQLPPSDPNGLADPYLFLYTDFCSKKLRTTTINESLNPQWGDMVTLVPEFGDVQYVRNSYIYFIVYDQDAIGSDDLLGQAVLSMEDTSGSGMSRAFDIPIYTEVCTTGINAVCVYNVWHGEQFFS